jgi:predicted GTPase
MEEILHTLLIEVEGAEALVDPDLKEEMEEQASEVTEDQDYNGLMETCMQQEVEVVQQLLKVTVLSHRFRTS